ncbi:MAG: tetratricopeptide repeat protein [Proteobacteria bacterium]|nr:tetratricopeptide repeat protein [Pseudomonadota bacterium]MBU1386434.1 tetratricopeptide repeat protein [Pseudomonadota bacterium]MBU1544545.1 tetratricopeptide repeat protein [Pseudomonadota bacterium]MBU2480995.1 tetratricopeptide repeat protein [Pseudomonadota bacterium]
MQKFWVIILLLLLLPWQIMAAQDIPFTAGICVNKANLLIQQEKIDQAVILLEDFARKQQTTDKKTAVQKGYDHYYIDFLLGNCFLMLDQKNNDSSLVEKAALAYGRAVGKKPDLSAAWLNLAKCRYELGQMKKAAQAFIRGYETGEDKKPDSLYYASVCHTLANDHEQALLVFSRLIADHPEEISLEWKQTLVNIYFSLEKHEQALPLIEELAEKFQNESKKKWQEILLYQYVTLGKDKKALDYAGFLTSSDPCEPKWWKALTHIHLGRDRLEDGLASLIIYSFIAPLSQQEITLAADLYMACGIPLKAAQYYEKWLDSTRHLTESGNHADTSPHIQNQTSDQTQNQAIEKISKIARAYLNGCEKNTALQWIDKGLAMKIDPDLLCIKADLLFQKKNYISAFHTYEQLTEFKKHKGFAFLMMGYAAWNEGMIQQAIKAFTAATDYKEQKTTAQKALARLQSFSGNP